MWLQEDAFRDTSNQKYDEAISSVEMAQMQDKLERTSKELEEKQAELTNAKRDLDKTEKELSTLKSEISLLKSGISKLENDKKEQENKLQAEKKESSYWESKASELETDFQVCNEINPNRVYAIMLILGKRANSSYEYIQYIWR